VNPAADSRPVPGNFEWITDTVSPGPEHPSGAEESPPSPIDRRVSLLIARLRTRANVERVRGEPSGRLWTRRIRGRAGRFKSVT
jgi:hypothetical protein